MKVYSEVDHCPLCGALANPRWDACISCGQKLDLGIPRTAEADRPHCIILRTEPYPDETDADDPDGGRRIVAAVEANGGTLTIERHGIALRWTGHMPNTGAIIDRIRTNRIGVVKALAG